MTYLGEQFTRKQKTLEMMDDLYREGAVSEEEFEKHLEKILDTLDEI